MRACVRCPCVYPSACVQPHHTTDRNGTHARAHARTHALTLHAWYSHTHTLGYSLSSLTRPPAHSLPTQHTQTEASLPRAWGDILRGVRQPLCQSAQPRVHTYTHTLLTHSLGDSLAHSHSAHPLTHTSTLPLSASPLTFLAHSLTHAHTQTKAPLPRVWGNLLRGVRQPLCQAAQPRLRVPGEGVHPMLCF